MLGQDEKVLLHYYSLYLKPVKIKYIIFLILLKLNN